MENCAISVDWLQTFCLGTEIQEGEYVSRGYKFRVQLQPNETPQFKRVYKVYYKKYQCAIIQQQPRTSVINPNATLVKIDNRILYCHSYIDILYAIQEALHLKYKGITRIDICYDCNFYAGHRSPVKFINQYVGEKVESEKFLHRSGSNQFSCYGSKSASSSARVTSIRFGSTASRVGAYIYDKTQELKEVKDKPWIRDTWKKNGIISDDENHVYRSEISIKAQGVDLLNLSSGELFKLNPQYLNNQDAIERLFYIYANKYFDFRVRKNAKLVKHFTKIELFEHKDELTAKPYNISNCADTGRMEKICENKLRRLSAQYSDISGAYTNALSMAIEFLQQVSGMKYGATKHAHESMYLDTLKGQKWQKEDFDLYINTLQYCHEQKKEISAAAAWDMIAMDSELSQVIYDKEYADAYDDLCFP